MKRMTLATVVGLAYALAGGLALAQEAPEAPADDDQLTLTLIEDPEAELPEAVTYIALPDEASGTGRENSADGLEIANEARQGGVRGRDVADEARERGRALGEEMAERAQERRENNARGRDGLDLPGRPEDLPTPPSRHR